MGGRALAADYRVGSGGGVQDVAQALDREPRLMEILPAAARAAGTGCARPVPANMLKAISSPTVRLAVDHQLGTEVRGSAARDQLADQLDEIGWRHVAQG